MKPYYRVTSAAGVAGEFSQRATALACMRRIERESGPETQPPKHLRIEKITPPDAPPDRYPITLLEPGQGERLPLWEIRLPSKHSVCFRAPELPRGEFLKAAFDAVARDRENREARR